MPTGLSAEKVLDVSREGKCVASIYCLALLVLVNMVKVKEDRNYSPTMFKQNIFALCASLHSRRRHPYAETCFQGEK